MKFTAEQIEYLERVIELEGLDIVGVKDHIWGNVDGYVTGHIGDNLRGDTLRNVFGEVI
tara:strand:+ start:693 stop:869 length:177 start_codon:yes stop_codon:yes gene_type:complete